LWDEHGCEVPIGEVGEIVIESEYLALGYWQKQQANAEMFVPISATSSIRRFRTGDLGKFLPDGCLVHLGRKDFQVKIRGYRIDVAEVEMALMDSNLLKEVVVVGQELNPGELSLVAYCVLLKQSGVAAKQLRRVIRQSLPDYMMPSLFIFLDALPLTPNGKLDRKALPMPDRSQQTIGTVFVPAQTTLEKEISQIWCNLLNLNRVGINDNFFDLGGNSIVAAQFFSKIEQKIGQYLPLALLAEAPTIKEIADLIQRQNWTDSWSSLVPLQSYGDRLPLFICHGINGNVLNLKNLVDELDSQQPVYGLQAQGLDGETVPFTSIEAIAAHYIQMIQRVQLQGPYYIGGYSFGGKVAFEMACQLKQQGHEVALLFLLDTYSPYGLQRISDIPLSLFGRAKLHWKRFSTGGTSYLVERFQYRLNQFNFLTKTSDETAILVNKDENLNTISQASERIKNANLQARKNYNPNFYSGKITLFRAVPGRPIPEGWRVDSLLGWGDLSSSIEVHKLYGNHGSFLNYPHVTEFANILSQCIKEATLLH
jgi:thioesterase domain-containing protein/acyl carrier protein